MVRLTAGLLLVLPCAGCTATVPSSTSLSVEPDSGTERAILAARDAIWRAWFAHDTAQLGKLIPEALAAGGDDNSTQRWTDRAQELDASRQFVANGGALTKLAFPRTEVRVMGDVAVVFSSFDVETTMHGSPHSMIGQSTEIFVRRNGYWVNPFWHLGS